MFYQRLLAIEFWACISYAWLINCVFSKSWSEFQVFPFALRTFLNGHSLRSTTQVASRQMLLYFLRNFGYLQSCLQIFHCRKTHLRSDLVNCKAREPMAQTIKWVLAKKWAQSISNFPFLRLKLKLVTIIFKLVFRQTILFKFKLVFLLAQLKVKTGIMVLSFTSKRGHMKDTYQHSPWIGFLDTQAKYSVSNIVQVTIMFFWVVDGIMLLG